MDLKSVLVFNKEKGGHLLINKIMFIIDICFFG